MYHEKLTQKDVERLQEEIDHRKLVVRKEAIEAVKEARAQGDLSENFEYYAAKRDKNKNESRIRYLERMIKNAEIITDNSRDDEVGLNNTVQLYMEEDDETETYKLVTSIRGNAHDRNQFRYHLELSALRGAALSRYGPSALAPSEKAGADL